MTPLSHRVAAPRHRHNPAVETRPEQTDTFVSRCIRGMQYPPLLNNFVFASVASDLPALHRVLSRLCQETGPGHVMGTRILINTTNQAFRQ